ncbi:LLM class flavin-dependent oxidoreductase [Gordoniibacillus kamchatkensis]|uniref:LLM class flavin-dependent oxidoreductase n=1 Tax=Gordoniibacillus kamchatkensis TaxID=1590651 RepID=UPI000AF2F819|nr:LLM class flavin-dependent oxidoreductase [Paenibacillus sp. VKM B-2647]
MELAQAADRLGYTRFWVAEHHSTPGIASSSPEVLVAALAARTSRIRIGSGGVLLSHYSALKVAEQFRTLEALYPGRIDLGIGRAPGGMPRTAAALRDGRPDAPERFPEQLGELACFLTDTVPTGHRHEGISAVPLIDSAPQLWLLGSTDRSAQFAAGLGAAFAFAHFINGSGGESVVQSYKRSFRPSALGAVPEASAAVYVLCADTDEEAGRLAASADLQLLRQEKGEFGDVPSPAEAAAYPYGKWDGLRIAENRKRMIVGGPETVRNRLLAFSRQYGVGEVIVVTTAYEFGARLRSYELLAQAMRL